MAVLTRDEWGLAFGLFLRAAGIRHFSALELCEVGRVHGAATLQPPPPELWPHILPTARLADELREASGAPLIVNSGYRDPVYNRAVAGSADRSQHLEFRALDLRSVAWTPAQVADWLDEHPASGTLGIGRYRTFTHLDTRGRRARWGS